MTKTKEDKQGSILDDMETLGALLDEHYKLKGYKGYRDYQEKHIERFKETLTTTKG